MGAGGVVGGMGGSVLDWCQEGGVRVGMEPGVVDSQRKRNEALRKRGKPAGGAPSAVSRTDSVDEIGDASEC